MDITAKKEDVIKLYKTSNTVTKKSLEKLYVKEHFVTPPKPKKVKNILDKINSIEDVFKYCKEDYKAFLKKWKDLPETVLNYMLLTKGIECLNEGWAPDFSNNNQPKWHNIFDISGSGFVFSNSDHGYAYDYAAVGSALRLESEAKANHAAKIFFPQYKGYMKPKK